MPVFDSLNRQGDACLVPTDGKVVKVAARLFQHRNDFEGLFDSKAFSRRAFDEVDRTPAHHNRVIGADNLSHTLQDLDRQTNTVFKATSILVGTIVRSARHETAQNTAHARHDLDRIKARLFAYAGGVEVTLLEFLDLLERHGLEAAHELEDGDIRRAVRALLLVGFGFEVMHKIWLRANQAAMLMDGIDHEFFQVGNALVAIA